MDNDSVNEIINSIKKISPKRSYWYFRTMGGRYYEDFVTNRFIAIGYDEVPMSEISKGNTKDYSGSNILTVIISRIYEDEQRPRFIANQLLDFSYNIKKGDVVVVPDWGSQYIAIGEVTETPVYTSTHKTVSTDQCPFYKRKKIKWIKKDISLASMDPRLLKLKYSRKTITSIDAEISSLIDRAEFPLFIKEDKAHLSLDIKQTEPIIAIEMFETWLELFKLSEQVGKDIGVDIKREDYQIKINVQSPGTIELISVTVASVAVLSAIILIFIGADFEFKAGKSEFKFKTGGIIDRIFKSMNSHQDVEMKKTLNKKLKKMAIDPEELAQILEQVKKPNE
jgi:restriction system protein